MLCPSTCARSIEHVRNILFLACASHNSKRCADGASVTQGFAQIPDLTVWYGPDTYMGRNLAQLFTSLADLPDEEVQKLHPKHTQASVRALLPRLHYFEEGTCIVHHIFGGEVTELVRKAYGDAYLTAHFEVGVLPLPVVSSSFPVCCPSVCAPVQPVHAQVAVAC